MSDLDDALARLDDYIRRHDAPESSDAYEQGLFERALAGAAPELGLRERLEAQLRVMDARGTLDLWLTARQVDELGARGLRIIRADFDPANPSMPDLSVDFDVLVTKVLLDLSGVRRLDAEICAPDGRRLKLMPDIGFDPADGGVYMCCEADLARASVASKAITRVWAHDDSGRHLLREIGLPEL